MTRGWKFRLFDVQILYFLCSINKGTDKLHDYHEADLHIKFSKKQIFHDKDKLNLIAIIIICCIEHIEIPSK